MAMERKWRCEKLDFPVDLEIYRPLEDTKHTLEIIFIESFSIISTSRHPPGPLHTYCALFSAKDLCFQITSFCFVLRIFCLQNFCLSTPFPIRLIRCGPLPFSGEGSNPPREPRRRISEWFAPPRGLLFNNLEIVYWNDFSSRPAFSTIWKWF